MRILLLADPNSIHDQKWINYFDQQDGVKVFLICREIHKGDMKWMSSFEDVRFLGSIPDFSIRRFRRTLSTISKLKKWIGRNKIQIFNCHYAEPNALWFAFSRLLGTKNIITTLGTDILKTIPEAFAKRDPLNRVVALLYKRAFLQADFVTGTSIRQLDSVAKFSGRTSQTAIVRTGVDLPRLQADTTKHFPLTDPSHFLLFPRYIKPLYNHLFCLEAIGQLPRSVTDQYQMVFVGKDSGDLDYQVQMEALMETMPHVRFVFLPKQSQEALFELYKRASVVVMTPLSDGSPVSAMEALLCGKPVILGPLAYDQDLFEGKTWQLHGWDAAELATLIKRAFSEPLPSLSAEDQQRMDLIWNMERVMGIYQQLISSHL